MARIVDSVLVDQDSSDQSTELDQRMPIAAIAGEARCLDGEHGADATFADRRQQALEAWAVDAATGTTEIFIDHLDIAPTELVRTIRKPILSAPALLIVDELISRRLPDVNVCASCKMFRRDLGHRRSPRLQALWQSRAAAPASASLARPSVRAPARREARPRRTGPVAGFRIGASFPSLSSRESDWRKLRSALVAARSERRFSRENCGSAESVKRAARSCVIHAGMQATDPSGCGMTTSSTPR